VLPTNIDLNLVKVFLAIYDEGSVTRAAQRLCLTQPTVSYSLAKLRELFDDPLFERTPSGMRPTESGERIYGDFCGALALVEHAVDSNKVFVAAESQRRFRLSMSDIGELVFLPPLLERLSAEAPHVALEVVPTVVEAIPEMLASGRLDAAIGNLAGVRLGSTTRTSLFRERYVCLLSRHSSSIGDQMTLDAFTAARHVVVSSPFTGHRMIEEALREHGLAQHITAKIANFTGLPGLLARTNLVAIVPSRVGKVFLTYGPLRVLEIPIEMPTFDVTLHWHTRQHNVAATAWLRDVILETLHESN
jgi:DNA-binding transcriptional LysR family regulator